ncbi:hypothetical protein VTL71DRAFT_2151 [Oculimacula yallundae]|uniref:F-box domain-containing protein n=1 Tax=Oculimacula yallundae TaxID=86028 RepID=A0ABR4C842_9HELO
MDFDASATSTMAVHKPISIDSLPEEIQEHIIRCVPSADLLSVMLTSRTFFRLAHRYLYQHVHYREDNSWTPSETDVNSLRTCSWAPDITPGGQSTQIVHPWKFLRSIEQNRLLASFVEDTSFSITTNMFEKLFKKYLDLVRPRTTSLTLTDYRPFLKFGLMATVTNLDVMYPPETMLKTWQQSSVPSNRLRERIHILFSYPSVRHLTLRDARCWNAFSTDVQTSAMVKSSNIVSLFLPNTVATDVDLAEILTWPKALKYYTHENEERYRQFFQTGGDGRITSAKYFLESISVQRESLEVVLYNHGTDCCGDDCTYFDPNLLRGFTNLKYLSVPRTCFVNEVGHPNPIYMSLPPNLEVLCLDQDGYLGDFQFEARLKAWLQEILEHKAAMFPYLNSIILAVLEEELCNREDYPEVLNLLERMELQQTFEDAKVGLSFILE